MSYRVSWSKKASKHFRQLDNPIRERVGSTIDDLANDPRPRGVRPVTGMPGVLRVREGDYRVLYKVDDDEREVWIEDVRPRGEAYRR